MQITLKRSLYANCSCCQDRHNQDESPIFHDGTYCCRRLCLPQRRRDICCADWLLERLILEYNLKTLIYAVATAFENPLNTEAIFPILSNFANIGKNWNVFIGIINKKRAILHSGNDESKAWLISSYCQKQILSIHPMQSTYIIKV